MKKSVAVIGALFFLIILTQCGAVVRGKIKRSIKHDDPGKMSWVVDKGIDINTKFGEGYTLLLNASYAGSIQVAEYLLSEGADPNDSDNLGNNPLHYAARNDDTQMISLLIQNGCNINKKNTQGNTPLLIAVFLTNSESTAILIREAAGLDAVNGTGQTALHIAVYNKELEISKLLLDAGANPNILTDSGYSCLHQAAYDDEIELARELVKAGSAIDSADNAEQATPLHYAVFMGNSEIVRYLLENGAEPNLRNAEGYNALDIANGTGNSEIAEIVTDAL